VAGFESAFIIVNAGLPGGEGARNPLRAKAAREQKVPELNIGD
jgi:hypothetical protein